MGKPQKAMVFVGMVAVCAVFILVNKALVIDRVHIHRFQPDRTRWMDTDLNVESHRKVKAKQRDQPLLLTQAEVGDDTVTSQTYVKRRQQVDDVCSVTGGGAVLRMAQHKQSNVAYCVIPKVGCTYWLSVLRWLQKDAVARKYSSPFEIPRHLVHGTSPPVNYYTFSSPSQAPRFLSQRFRFMFVREPYSRLWSSYVDKFLLPDFWHLDGRAIARRRPNVTHRARSCGHNVTFPEFLAYVTKSDVRNLNPHYRPYHHVCSACLFRPHFVGKMESFGEDSGYLLQHHINLTDGNRNGSTQRTPEARGLQEMTLLIEDAFHELDKFPAFFRRCTTPTHLAQRLWKAFQLNGHLPGDVELPWAGGREVDQVSLKELVEKAYLTRSPKDGELWRRQKERAMIEAYQEVPDSVLEKLRSLYRVDFLMFGYDPFLRTVYSGRGRRRR